MHSPLFYILSVNCSSQLALQCTSLLNVSFDLSGDSLGNPPLLSFMVLIKKGGDLDDISPHACVIQRRPLQNRSETVAREDLGIRVDGKWWNRNKHD